eukprot:13953.XXX_529034_528297_1 [CDS] Oithona nana genome sequencing.
MTSNPDNQLRIAVEGNIGSGKSTFLSHFQTFEGVYVVPEPLDQWTNLAGRHNLLQSSFKDPKRCSFQFQSFVQLTRLKVWNQEAKHSKVKIVERSIHSNRYVYLEVARQSGNLNAEEYEVLCSQYETMSRIFDFRLDLIIYLRSDPMMSYERMLSRGRIEESDAKLKYLQNLHEAYENWLINSNSTKNMYSIKVIDANQSQEQMWEEMSFKNDPISRLKQLSEK